MSERQEKNILLNESVEYLIFNHTPISISFKDSDIPVTAYIFDKNENAVSLFLQEHDSEKLKKCIGGPLFVSCNYRSKRLEFVAALVDYDEKNSTVCISMPHHGLLVNYRLWERTTFSDKNFGLCAELIVDTILGIKRFEANEFFEFSYDSISLSVDRRFGLIMPNDLVREIKVKENGRDIFFASGRVVRIEQSAGQDDKYLIVVLFNGPNVKMLFDIEPSKRQSDRYVFQEGSEAFIEFVHPFSRNKKIAKLYDISNSGISVIMQDGRFAIPPGLIIENASMQLPLHARVTISLQVKGYSKEEVNNDVKINMEFVNASAALVKEVSSMVQVKISEHLHDASYEDIEELWYFYFETGFIYEKKRRQLQSNSDVVKNTFKKLLMHNTPLIKKILYKEDGAIKGHVTAIKVFDRTLMVQHLNALKTNSGPAAMQVIRGITSYFLDSTANEASGSRYICFYYRPDNFYPELVFGSSVKIIRDDDMCWIENFQFCLPNENTSENCSQADDIEVREASERDLSELEKLLIRDREFKIIRLEGLARETMTDMSISSEYESIGLYRYRKVFVAQSNTTGACVYAVCTYASPGLNFSELTNSIKLFCSSSLSGERQALVDAVARMALDSYTDTQIDSPVLLLKEHQPVPTSFRIDKNYILFALDVRTTKKFKDATEQVFSNFKEFVRERRKQAS